MNSGGITAKTTELVGGFGISIKDDLGQLSKRMTNIERQQLPFALANALTQTAKKLLNEEKREMRRSFDKPTRYIMNSIAYLPAKKTEDPMVARVFFRFFGGKGGEPNKFLTPQISGGKRRLKRHEIALQAKGILPRGKMTAVAKDAPLNSYGNLSAATYVRILSQTKSFAENGYKANQTTRSRKRNNPRKSGTYYVAQKNGVPVGIRKRQGGKSVKILNFITPPTYKPRFDFYGKGQAFINKTLPRQFKTSLRFALNTAKKR